MPVPLSEDIARAILREFYSGDCPTVVALARKYDLHPSTITRLISGETHRHLLRPRKPRAIAPTPPRFRVRPLTRSQEIAAVMVALDYPAEEIAARLALNAVNAAKLLANPTVKDYAQALASADMQVVQLALLCIALGTKECGDLLSNSTHPVAVRAREAGKASVAWLDSAVLDGEAMANAIAPSPLGTVASAAIRLINKGKRA